MLGNILRPYTLHYTFDSYCSSTSNSVKYNYLHLCQYIDVWKVYITLLSIVCGSICKASDSFCIV